ncbi:hypothetical protein BLA29_001879 [Euroglyphus maynei]|uniref:CHHC U11-48K-type domain-containing protein n=1 Tax=Euroglyphus maynei TaxID=6958 RepID=A0A1Y3BCQ4_EURMA|nr:hypothetical protein BLA29_001879 [Euroglyphus maynei]
MSTNFLICPINPNHKVNETRYNEHLSKCKSMNPKKFDEYDEIMERNSSQNEYCSNEDYSSSSLIGEESDDYSDSIREPYTMDIDEKSGKPIITAIDWQRLEQVETFQHIPYDILMIMTINQRQHYKDCLFNHTKYVQSLD